MFCRSSESKLEGRRQSPIWSCGLGSLLLVISSGSNWYRGSFAEYVNGSNHRSRRNLSICSIKIRAWADIQDRRSRRRDTRLKEESREKVSLLPECKRWSLA